MRIVTTIRCRAASPPLLRTEPLAAPIVDEDDDEEEGAYARHSVRGGVGASEEYEWGEDCGGSSAELICVAAYRAATSVATFKVNELIVLGARSNFIGHQSRASY